MPWQVLILLQCLLVAFSVIFLRALAAEKSTASASFAINAGQYIWQYLIGIIVVVSANRPIQAVLGNYFWLIGLVGISFAFVNIFTYKMLAHFDAAISSIVGTLNTVLAAFGAVIALNESMSGRQVLGAAMLLLIVVYALSLTRTNGRTIQRGARTQGITYGVLAAVCFAVAAVTEKFLVSHMNLSTYLVFGWGSQVAMSVVVLFLFNPASLAVFRRQKTVLLTSAAGIFRAAGGLCFLGTIIKTNNVALMSLVSNFRLILIVLLAALLLKERQKLKQKFAAAGAAILALSSLLL